MTKERTTKGILYIQDKGK
nr:hypothetical protein [Sicyoidochytrium minutum DNA virus]